MYSVQNALMGAILSVLVIGLFGCEEEKEVIEEADSTWQLEAILADPGDGSGTFQTVESDKTVSFYADGTLTSNGSLCIMGVDTDTTFNATYNSADLTIETDCWSDLPIQMNYNISNDTLLIHYPCFEACIERYIQLP